MECSKIGYQRWAIALYLMLSNPKGVSSTYLAKALSIKQQHAWTLGHKIRLALKTDLSKFRGIVEVDETYIGGLEKNKHAKKKLHENWRDGKIAVIGLKERETKQVYAQVADEVSDKTLQGFIADTVKRESTVFTDGHEGYRGMDEYEHHWINHSIGQYVDGDCTTG